MEELSEKEFEKLNNEGKDAYLKYLLGPIEQEDFYASDSDDEDWFPVPQIKARSSEVSDGDETDENADDEGETVNEEYEEENEASEAETSDDEAAEGIIRIYMNLFI